MAGNYPFHGKLHRSTHHTDSTSGILESATDPIASSDSRFRGIFYTLEQGTSYNWYSAYLTLQASSGYWNSVYTTVNAFSAAYWQSVYTTVLLNSAGWESVETTVNVNSGKWESTYTTVRVYSGTWVDAYTNLANNSASYLRNVSSVGFDPIYQTDLFYQGRIQQLNLNYGTIQTAVSALHQRVNALFTLLAGLTAGSSTVLVSITSNN